MAHDRQDMQCLLFRQCGPAVGARNVSGQHEIPFPGKVRAGSPGFLGAVEVLPRNRGQAGILPLGREHEFEIDNSRFDLPYDTVDPIPAVALSKKETMQQAAERPDFDLTPWPIAKAQPSLEQPDDVASRPAVIT